MGDDVLVSFPTSTYIYTYTMFKKYRLIVYCIVCIVQFYFLSNEAHYSNGILIYA